MHISTYIPTLITIEHFYHNYAQFKITINRQKFTVKKFCGSQKQQTLNAQKFSIEYIAIHSYPLSANIFNKSILKMNIFYTNFS